MMRILLLGSTGQVGWELERTLSLLGELITHSRSTIDLSNLDILRECIQSVQPELIVNAAAYTAVDTAEHEPELAHKVNAQAPGLLAREAKSLGAGLIHYSTDYVFDGRKEGLYEESDPVNPISVYGASKLAGEEQIVAADPPYWILRTSWVFSLRRNCFPLKVLKWLRTRSRVSIAEDQTGSPTWARHLAEITALMIMKFGGRVPDGIQKSRGIYHVAGSGAATRYEFARAVLELDPAAHEHTAGYLQPGLAADFPVEAQRPANSALDCRKIEQTFGFKIPAWRRSLKLAMQDFQPSVLKQL